MVDVYENGAESLKKDELIFMMRAVKGINYRKSKSSVCERLSDF